MTLDILCYTPFGAGSPKTALWGSENCTVTGYIGLPRDRHIVSYHPGSGVRVYSPNRMMFNQHDPTLHGFDFYGYTRDPVNKVDFNGLFPCIPTRKYVLKEQGYYKVMTLGKGEEGKATLYSDSKTITRNSKYRVLKKYHKKGSSQFFAERDARVFNEVNPQFNSASVIFDGENYLLDMPYLVSNATLSRSDIDYKITQKISAVNRFMADPHSGNYAIIDGEIEILDVGEVLINPLQAPLSPYSKMRFLKNQKHYISKFKEQYDYINHGYI